MKILLDTHTLYWSVVAPERLSEKVRTRMFAPDTSEILVSAISVWELGKLQKKNRIQFHEPLPQWIKKALSLPKISLINVDPDIFLESCNLPGEFNSDPGDEIIVATARLYDATLLTKDQKILAYPHVKSEW